jgi:dihydroneopterin aldolase
LLEHFAQQIANVVLGDPRVAEVTVEVDKLRPPVAHDLASSGVRITRKA